MRLSAWLRLSELLFCVAVEYSLALGPAPVWAEVAVAVCVLDPFGLPTLFVGFANALPKARVMAVASKVFFIEDSWEVGRARSGNWRRANSHTKLQFRDHPT